MGHKGRSSLVPSVLSVLFVLFGISPLPLERLNRYRDGGRPANLSISSAAPAAGGARTRSFDSPLGEVRLPAAAMRELILDPVPLVQDRSEGGGERAALCTVKRAQPPQVRNRIVNG